MIWLNVSFGFSHMQSVMLSVKWILNIIKNSSFRLGKVKEIQLYICLMFANVCWCIIYRMIQPTEKQNLHLLLVTYWFLLIYIVAALVWVVYSIGNTE